MAEKEEDNNLLVSELFPFFRSVFFCAPIFVSLAYDALNAHSNLTALISLELVASVHSRQKQTAKREKKKRNVARKISHFVQRNDYFSLFFTFVD